MSLRDVGWAWEGQGLDPGVPASIYGLGQGARYFGLRRANFMFHSNDEYALDLLKDYEEVTCDISKWGWEWEVQGRPKCHADGDPRTVLAEGLRVAELARRYPNVTGVFCDDVMGLMQRHGYGPDEFAEIRSAIRRANPDLAAWAVVYTHEFSRPDYWRAMAPHIDVVNLWVWDSARLDRLESYIDECRGLLPGKPIIMGVYLRDYGVAAPVPVDRLVRQMEQIGDLVRQRTIQGFSILGAVLIDGHRDSANAIRDFLASH